MTKSASFLRVSAPLLLALLLAVLTASAQNPVPPVAAGDNFPAIQLPAVSRGSRAVSALGASLPSVARAYGLQAAQLRVLLAADGALAVDRNGRLHFTDPAPEGIVAAPGEVGFSEAAIPLEETFQLHSRPGASRTIYLDFDGHLVSGTGWNQNYNAGADIAAPAWDTDGNPGSHGNAERTVIQNVWRRVAEDFAPFDVNVTTEPPPEDRLSRSGIADDTFGVRVLVSPISSYFGNYGGIAYVGSFDDTTDYYKPALVFPENMGNVEKYIAEACSHEAGHTLGLRHDGVTGGSAYYAGHGSGEIGWAPIMGSGYSKNVTQWSRGEYAGASNTQDDLAVIQVYGLPLRADDHGNDSQAASYLPPGSPVSAAGIIEGSSDVDVFAFTTGAGEVSLAVAPAGLGPNLDVLLRLHDAGGNLLAEENPASGLAAALSLNLPAGTYFVSVQGVGAGDPLNSGYSSYAALGHYRLTATVVDASGDIPPVAVVAANPLSGEVPLLVQFDGAQSFDTDGSIVSHEWSFGDGGTASGVAPQHLYGNAGNFTATLTVTDDSGLTATDSVVIEVLPINAPPVAQISAAPVSGMAPLPVSFSAAGSTDTDGGIVIYAWNFGDGSTATGISPDHTYATPGTYSATLTVTDDRGAASSQGIQINVTADPAKVMRVALVTVTVQSVKGGQVAGAVVQITTPDGQPVAGASVSGSWSGAVSGTGSGVTDANGFTTISSTKHKAGGAVTFTVGDVSQTGWTYDPAQNVTDSGTYSGGGGGDTGGGGGGGGNGGGKPTQRAQGN